MKIPAALGRKLLAFLDDEDTRHDEAYALAESLRRYNQPKRSLKPAKQRREAKRADRREEMAAIRAAVVSRATHDGVLSCECCGRYARDGQMDHWLAGCGRRCAEQSVETCWWLCVDCHDCRTRNDPNAEYWNQRFRAHCFRHGYPFRPHLVRQPLQKGAR